ncbi:MAG: energy-coupling factor ABC transporter ATP-binding protein [Thermoproteota archaeon]
MNETALEMEDIKYVYPDGHTALENLNMRVMRGERVAILGPNGAGKSTLLMLTNGLFTPSKGRVNVLGMPVNKNNLYKVRMKVGLVFQDPDDQLFCPTLWEDVTFGPLNMGLSEEEVARRAEDALRVVGLEGLEEKPPHHLSVGEKKKAAIAVVLVMEPEILILDEPTANLDPKSKTELAKLVDNLYKERKITLITATHDVDFVPTVADRVYVLNKGRIIAEGTVREAFSNFKIMTEANLEPPIVTRLFSLLNEQSDIDLIKPLPLTIQEALYEIKRLMKTSRVS